MKHILLGLLMIATGTACIVYHNQLYKMFGDIARAERNLGSSKAAYVLAGTALIVIGVLVMFGMAPSNPAEIKSDFQGE